MEVNLFGWDLIYRSVESQLSRKEDLLVAFTHWFLIKNGFLCIGNGRSKIVTGEEVQSEVLTEGWNKDEDYNLRYIQDDKLYLLRASITDKDIIFNFLRPDDLCISSCVFEVDEVVKDFKGNITTAMPNYKTVLGALRRELLEPVFTKSTTSATGTQTTTTTGQVLDVHSDLVNTSPSRGSLIIGPRRPVQPINSDHIWNNPDRDPVSVGVSDLDPFSRGGCSGMIFDPLGQERRNRNVPGPSFPGLPRSAVPPGARFDPFMPPTGWRGNGRGRGGRSDPDPDHLPPPGYDDMFI